MEVMLETKVQLLKEGYGEYVTEYSNLLFDNDLGIANFDHITGYYLLFPIETPVLASTIAGMIPPVRIGAVAESAINNIPVQATTHSLTSSSSSTLLYPLNI